MGTLMRVSILLAIALSVHAAPVDLKLFPGVLPVMLPEEPATPLCFHAEDTEDHKCFEACSADGTKFATKGITAAGTCPTKYNTVDTTKTVLQCPDGVTNVRYCAGAALNVTIATKGEAGENLFTNLLVGGKAHCSSDKDCPSSYCQHPGPAGVCHGCGDACCQSDKDCPGSYCVNDPTKMPPFTCHDTAAMVDFMATAPAAPVCFHAEDTEDHKCFEACNADGKQFATKGITAAGTCPTKYNTVDTTKTVLQCPDGVTNVRYCAGTALNVTIATKGEAGAQSF